jgi:hypothetical protein
VVTGLYAESALSVTDLLLGATTAVLVLTAT